MKSSLSLHSIIKQSKYRAASCHQVFKQTSPLRSPKTWWDDLSHWNRAHCDTEESEAAPESSRSSSTWKITWFLAGDNFPFYAKLSFSCSPPQHYRVQLLYQHHPFARQYAALGVTELLNYRLRNWVRNQKNAVYYCRLFSLLI